MTFLEKYLQKYGDYIRDCIIEMAKDPEGISLKCYEEEPANSHEKELLLSNMRTDDLIEYIKTYILPNCQYDHQPPNRTMRTYDDALVNKLIPLLFRRLNAGDHINHYNENIEEIEDISARE